jgi:hypothetical protein
VEEHSNGSQNSLSIITSEMYINIRVEELILCTNFLKTRCIEVIKLLMRYDNLMIAQYSPVDQCSINDRLYIKRLINSGIMGFINPF